MLLLVDGNFGFEMETFEFLNVLQASGAGARALSAARPLTAPLSWHDRCTASPR